MSKISERIGYTAAGCAADATRRVRHAVGLADGYLRGAESNGRETVAAMRGKVSSAKDRLEQRVHGMVSKEVGRLGLATQADLDGLRDRLDKIDAKLNSHS